MTTPTPQPATPELLALAAATRSDVDVRDLEGAIAEAAGRVPWPQILVQTARMLARGEDVRDLRAALDDPLGLHGPRTRRPAARAALTGEDSE
jgi:hypothetical protein